MSRRQMLTNWVDLGHKKLTLCAQYASFRVNISGTFLNIEALKFELFSSYVTVKSNSATHSLWLWENILLDTL